jgi:hypothetical protein
MLDNHSRRDFLLTGLALTGTSVACSSKKNIFEQAVDESVKPSGKKVKLLGVDGNIV